jgi:hypothetical protein
MSIAMLDYQRVSPKTNSTTVDRGSTFNLIVDMGPLEYFGSLMMNQKIQSHTTFQTIELLLEHHIVYHQLHIAISVKLTTQPALGPKMRDGPPICGH